MMNIPEEVTYKIFSYLPGKVLAHLDLSNKQYWNICRIRNKNCLWDDNIVWIEQLLDTSEMYLKDDLYVHTLYGLCSLGSDEYSPPDSYTPKIAVQEGVVSFKTYLDGYVWHPSNCIDFTKIKQILNHHDNTLEKTIPKFKFDLANDNPNTREKVMKFFFEEIAPYLDLLNLLHEKDISNKDEFREKENQNGKLVVGLNWALSFKNSMSWLLSSYLRDYSTLKGSDEYSVKLPIPMILYLKDKIVNWKEEELNLVEAIEIVDNLVYKVVKRNCKTMVERDIGRAVLSPKLYDMILNSIKPWMNPQTRYNIGVALFGNEKNNVYAFGNFDCNKTVKVFQHCNFALVKSDLNRDDSESDWEDVEEEEDFSFRFPWEDTCSESDEYEEEIGEESELEEGSDEDGSSRSSSPSEFNLDTLFGTTENLDTHKEMDRDTLFNTGEVMSGEVAQW